MIESIVGNKSAEKVLLYLANYSEGYARAIALCFNIPVFSVQSQLRKFEAAGVLISQLKGKTRVYYWSPRFALKKEFLDFLNKALDLLPEEEKKKYFRKRTRPRRAGKPI